MATDIKELGLLGKKIGMTQVFDEEGNVVPVTAIEIAENVITEILTEEKNGYTAVQVGNFETKEKHITKPLKVSLEKKDLKLFRKLKEFRTHEAVDGLNIGDEINIEDYFKDLEKINITGFTTGKGFQGGVKAHNMHIGRRSHGSKSHRQIGSLGAGTYPGRVFKGKRMPKRLGNKQFTTTKVKVFSYDPETRVLLVKGPVHGKRGNQITITASGLKSWNHYNKKAA